MVLYVLALRNLIRAARWAQDYEPATARSALDRFDAQVPDAIAIRDLLEHFDDYERGRGRLQNAQRRKRSVGPPIAEFFYYFERSPDSYIIHLAGAYKLDIAKATPAAQALGEEVMGALADGRL